MKTCPACGLRYPPEIPRCFVDNTPLVEAPDPYLNTVIRGKYRVESLLGEGGMATVYKARTTLADRPVAIKLFRKELARDPKLRERFKREATSTSHPSLASERATCWPIPRLPPVMSAVLVIRGESSLPAAGLRRAS